MSDLKTTMAFKSHLEHTLQLARQRLGQAEYEAVSAGLNHEISRLNKEIDRARIESFMINVESENIVPRVIRFHDNISARFTRNEPHTMGRTQDIGLPRIVRYYIYSRPLGVTSEPKRSLVMNPVFQL